MTRRKQALHAPGMVAAVGAKLSAKSLSWLHYCSFGVNLIAWHQGGPLKDAPRNIRYLSVSSQAKMNGGYLHSAFSSHPSWL